MKIQSIQIGVPKTIEYNGKKITTGIFKDPVAGPLLLKALGLVGDGQADLSVHGGLDKALYAYPLDVYKDWQKLRPDDEFANGAFGENLCMDTLPENKIYIGDTYELGEAIVQVTQPRYPCYKLAVKFKDPTILKQFMALNRPGVYFRVLKEGRINHGDELKLIKQEDNLLSIQELFHNKSSDYDLRRVEEILQIESLPNEWKSHFRALKKDLEE